MIIECRACRAQNRVPVARITSRANCGRCKAAICPPGTPLPIESDADFDELVRDSPLAVVVDFWASWCGPCRMVAPELEKLAGQRRGGIIVAKVDTEALPVIAQRFRIQSIPTMILFRGGAEAKRVSGAMSAQGIASSFAL